tara:strand:- start:2898 stop:3671 length:774 start_codon:yes stop_codon:yes gene_type:complete
MNNNKLTKYLFAIGAFIIVFYLAARTNNQETEIIANQNEGKMEENTFNQINSNDFSVNKEKLQDMTSFQSNNENESLELVDINNKNEEKIEFQKSIFVNSIKIAKQIDNDKNSDTYREPINAYKTITTLDENVTKEINYYPEFYIWASINTENMKLNTIENNSYEDLHMLNPAQLKMSVTCNNNIINEFNFQINAKTPRWREWIEIDLTQFESESIMGQWNIEIINTINNQVLETRHFVFNKELEADEIRQTADIIN